MTNLPNREEKKEELLSRLNKLIVRIICTDDLVTPKDCNDVFNLVLDQAKERGVQEGKRTAVERLHSRIRLLKDDNLYHLFVSRRQEMLLPTDPKKDEVQK